jgi:phage terminase small subunit
MTASRGNVDALIAAVAGGKTVVEAARLAGMSLSTAHRRLEDLDIQRRIRETRAAMFERAVGALADAVSAAVQTLVGCLDAEADTTRVRAAVAILDHAVKWRESEELAQRVAELEAALGTTEGSGKRGAA